MAAAVADRCKESLTGEGHQNDISTAIIIKVFRSFTFEVTDFC